MKDENQVKELVEKTFYKENGKMISQRVNQTFLANHDLLFLNEYFSDSLSLNETIYRIKNGIINRPKCPCCGKDVNFSRDNACFNIYCSPKCRNSSTEMKIKNALGVSKSMKKIYLEKGDEIKEKRAKTLYLHYGIETDSPFKIKEIQDLCSKRIEEKFGVNNVFQLDKNREKNKMVSRCKSVQLQKENGYDIEYTPSGDILVKNGCPICGDIVVSKQIFNNRTKSDRRGYTVLCPKCNPLRNNETSIERIVKQILEKNGILFDQHNRLIIKPLEMDFYSDSCKIGIECHGIFWHNVKFGKRFLQNEKFNKSKSVSVKLLQFWEDDILFNSDKVEDVIKSKFGLLERISAHKCKLGIISNKEAKSFLKSNSLYNEKSKIYIGLKFHNELVQVLGFNRHRQTFTLNNCCSKIGLQIFGGISKIFSYFKKEYKPKQVELYLRNDISGFSLFEKLGFEFIETQEDFFTISHNFKNKHFNCETNDENFICYTSGLRKFIWYS